jgi:vacuolar-type H+-ATPase subunit E/Vma4
MNEDIRGLIEKINEEGVRAAEKKAAEIEREALRKAGEIVARAKEEARALAAAAGQKAAETQEKTRALLGQAARDTLLSVHRELDAMLGRLIASEVSSALSAGDMERIISGLIKARGERPKEGEIIISLKKGDMDLLEKKFFGRLRDEARKGIVLKASEGARAGFTISFDGGKSCYDFSDKALAEYIGQFLKPKLSEILKSAVIDG